MPAPEPTEQVTEIRVTEPVASAPQMTVTSNDWPWWRGPSYNGLASGTSPPMEWSKTKNILWKTEIPGRGNSSPIIVGDRAYLTMSTHPPAEQVVLAFNVETGELNWRTAVHQNLTATSMNQKATFADSTLACDGESLFAVFFYNGGIHLSSLTLNGDVTWSIRLGDYHTTYGYGASPLLTDSFVVVIVDDPEQAFITAIHRKTGEVVWRIRRPSGESFSSPILAQIKLQSQILVPGKKNFISYHPATGDTLWSHESVATVACGTMAFSESAAFASCGMPKKETIALRGKINDQNREVLWSMNKPSQTAYVPSVLYFDNMLYVMNDDGMLTVFNAESGKVLGSKRISGTFTASPLIIDHKLIVVNEDGGCSILETAPPFKVVHENHVESGVRATPSISRGRIYFRSDHHLIAIGIR